MSKGTENAGFITRSRLSLWTLLVSIVICFALFRSYYADLSSSKVFIFPDNSPYEAPSHHEPLQQCQAPRPPTATPPTPENIWRSLTVEETTEITSWLQHPQRKLNLTDPIAATMSDNSIFLIEVIYPPKADALRYLNSPKTVSSPARYAKVTIHHGGQRLPNVTDYVLGPLPIGREDITLKKLTGIYHRDDIPYNSRGFASIAEVFKVFTHLAAPYAEALKDIFGRSAGDPLNSTLVASFTAPFSFDGSFRRTWLSFRKNVAGPYLHPINFWQYVDVSGTDANQWKVLKVVYNNQSFSSSEDFLSAWKNGTLIKPPKPADPQTEDLSWSSRNRTGQQRDLDWLPGPRSVSFAGLRFRVDKKLGYVSWLGWGMFFGFNRDMGLSLWDIRFRGDRIIYQLAPQEALAQYSGYDPMQTTTAWLDSFFGMGHAVRDLLPGYDCPHEAVYFPVTTHSSYGSMSRDNAICVFEQDSGRPVSRHTGYMDGEFGAVKGYILTVRSISTVGNYDYMFDYMFHIDGTIEVRVSASGYLQGGYWNPQQDPYGGRIGDASMGNLHSHVINFKVDFDIAGENNSLLRTATVTEEVDAPWFEDDWGSTMIQQRIDRTYITNESDAMLMYPVNFQGHYAIVNQDQRNKWGNPRGYAIHAGLSPIRNAAIRSKRVLKNVNWAKYNLAVSQRKDSEPTSSTLWNLHLPGDPAIDFHKFFDGESLNQTDLVAWINVGTHHIPQAEDSPNTKANVAASSFILTPLNYFDADVSMESSNAILIGMPKNPGDPFTYNDYGVDQQFTCIPRRPDPFTYHDPIVYANDGNIKATTSVEDVRRMADLFHRVQLEL